MNDNINDSERVQRFFNEYKKLCEKFGCLVISEGEQVEIVLDEMVGDLKDGLWGVVETTNRRGGWGIK